MLIIPSIGLLCYAVTFESLVLFLDFFEKELISLIETLCFQKQRLRNRRKKLLGRFIPNFVADFLYLFIPMNSKKQISSLLSDENTIQKIFLEGCLIWKRITEKSSPLPQKCIPLKDLFLKPSWRKTSCVLVPHWRKKLKN